MDNKKFTLINRLKSFRYAFNGIKLLIKGEPNAWIHCCAAVCVVCAGFILEISTSEWISIIIVIGSVLAAEAVNSAIESLSDKISKEYCEEIKKTKDLAAGAVLLLSISAAIIGLIIFIPKLIKLI